MKKIIYIFILISQFSFAQEVRVIDNKGTIHQVKNNQVITSDTPPVLPLEGDVWYDNTDLNNIISKIWDGNIWKNIESENKTIVLNRDGGSLPTATNIFFDLPVDASNTQYINTSYYNVNGTGEITVLQSGSYLIFGELSTSNMPSGETKFILALFINGVRRGYLSRGFASLPNTDYWGTTGVIMYVLNANDIVNIQYVLNAGGTTLNANFSNIGIAKL